VNDNKSTVNTPEENATAAAAAHANGTAALNAGGAHGGGAGGGAADAKSAADTLSRRVIKRYSNRKLYDTQDSRYVTLLQIAEMVRSGEEVQIIDNNSKEDLTEVTLAQIIYEEQKAHSRNVPLQTLKDLIHQRTEKVLGELRESPLGRLIPGKPSTEPPKDGETAEAAATEKGPSLVEQAKHTLEDWQHQIDERVKAVLPSVMPWQQPQHEVKRLSQRLEELEAKLKAASSNSGSGHGGRKDG
jgi:polyhydroxyalkanoate synthesis repressor PhaR